MKDQKAKIWVLAEAEPFFLPELVARLAKKGHVAGIIQIHFRDSLSKKLRSVRRLFAFFGLRTVGTLCIARLWAYLLNWASNARVFSLKKVARNFSLPFIQCQGFHDPKLSVLLKEHVKDIPLFVQVGRLVPKALTERHRLINKHCSLLPDYAGVYPVFWCMLHQEPYQGVTLHQMNHEFDKGPILAQAKVSNDGDFFSLYHRLYDLSFDLFVEVLGRPDPFNPPQQSIVSAPRQARYFSFPTCKERRQFYRNGLRYGWPLRARR